LTSAEAKALQKKLLPEVQAAIHKYFPQVKVELDMAGRAKERPRWGIKVEGFKVQLGFDGEWRWHADIWAGPRGEVSNFQAGESPQAALDLAMHLLDWQAQQRLQWAEVILKDASEVATMVRKAKEKGDPPPSE